MKSIFCGSRASWWRGVRSRVRLAAVGLIATVSISGPALGQSISGTLSGKQSAFVRYSNTFVLPNSGSVGVGSVTLAKGKKHKNVVVDVTVSYFNVSELTNPLFSLEVNGHTVPPLSWLFTCPANVQCLNSMTWWVDLDALEQQTPGEIIAQPLSLDLRLASEVPFPTTMSGMIVQMGARLQAQ